MVERFGEEVLKFARALAAKRADNITLIDVQDKTIIADWFVIADGHATTHVKAICDDVIEEMAKQGLTPRRKEGCAEGRWIVLDYGDVLVHIFHRDERAYYNIERLWSDGDNEMTYVEQPEK